MLIAFQNKSTFLPKKSTIKLEKASFLLSNKLGDFFHFAEFPQTRYHGWFVKENQGVFKVIESIKPTNIGQWQKITNHFWQIEKKSNFHQEKIFLAQNSHCLIYQANKKVGLEVFLDFKEIHQNNQEPDYQIKKDGDFLIVQCLNSQKKLFLVVKTSKGCLFDWQNASLQSRFYEYDKERNSPPFARQVKGPIKIKGKKIVFSTNESKEQAIKNCSLVWKKTRFYQNQQRKIRKKLYGKIKIKNNDLSVAYSSCRQSLYSLTAKENKNNYLMAGLPWFFQDWSRDEIISLKALSLIDFKLSKDIFFRWMESLSESFNLANIFGKKEENSDASGWLIKRAEGFILDRRVSLRQKSKIKKIICQSADYLIEKKIKNGLIRAKEGSTWMDTLKRSEFPLEIQCLGLSQLSLAYFLTKNKKYKKAEILLQNETKKRFWQKGILQDGDIDSSIRNNIFLAYYLYPNLLRKEEWEECFDNALKELFLQWGGVASVSIKDPDFHPWHSGESSESYHQGDSWFWVNNLSALCLARANSKKYLFYIKKITSASCQDILFQGVIGHHSEISSAEMLKAQGCSAQLWSAAMFCELIEELAKNKLLKSF